MARYPIILQVPVAPEMAAEIRRRAREDDRPVGAYLRRVLSTAIGEEPRG